MSSEEPCVVCFKQANYYSIGACDHPVCYECCTRMRVLCQQNECPICRLDMQKVYFTAKIRPFKTLEQLDLHLNDRKYKIWFEGRPVQESYNALLENRCPICPQSHVFSIFKSLEEHVSREHRKFYCDLCVKNLKIFSKERRCYERSQLSTHRRIGDADDKSHKGHPLCEFCDERYMDSDELYRHLRRDHFFCHFCDADGHHYYFNGYPDLKEHFMKEHFLCQEENCVHEQFTSVFRSEIDLKAHQASTHNRVLGKAGTKQAKKLEIDLNFPARQRGGGNRDGRFHPGEPSRYQDPEPVHQPTPQSININSEEFPSLGGAAPIVPVVTRRRQGPIEAFPALGPVDNSSNNNRGDRWTAAAAPKRNNQPHPTPTPKSGATPGPADFPSLPSTSSGGASSNQSASWNAVTKTKKQQKQPEQKVAPVKKPSKTVLSIAKNVQNRSNGNTTTTTTNTKPVPLTNRNKSSASSNNRYRDDEDDYDYNRYDDDISQYGLNSRSLPPQGYSKVQLIKSVPTSGPPSNSSQNNMNYTNIQGGSSNGETSSSINSNSKKVKMKTKIRAEDFPELDPSATLPPQTKSGPGGRPEFQYILPLQFTNRNVDLFDNIRSHIGNQFDEFKNMSSQFMRKGIQGEQYYSYVLTTLGRQGFNEVFPELLLLLPLIDRQKELWRVHHSNPSAKNRKVVAKLDQCGICGQIISSTGPELKYHLDVHKRQGGSGGNKNKTTSSSAWGART